MANLGDFLKSINTKNVKLGVLEVEEDYNPFIINRALSYFIDTVMYANEMNKYPTCDVNMQYDFYYYSLRKRSRFSPWVKPEKPTERVELLKEYYGYNTKNAEVVVDMIPESEFQRIKSLLNKGGK
jgi:hypothetical protein